MTSQDKQFWQRRINCWRAELVALGKRLDAPRHEDEVFHVVTAVKDLRVRMRRSCDELGIVTDSSDSLDRLINRILKVIG